MQDFKEADLKLNREPPQIMDHSDHLHPLRVAETSSADPDLHRELQNSFSFSFGFSFPENEANFRFRFHTPGEGSRPPCLNLELPKVVVDQYRDFKLQGRGMNYLDPVRCHYREAQAGLHEPDEDMYEAFAL